MQDWKNSYNKLKTIWKDNMNFLFKMLENNYSLKLKKCKIHLHNLNYWNRDNNFILTWEIFKENMKYLPVK